MPRFTLKRMAQLIGPLDGRDEAGTAYLHQQFRNFQAKSLLTPVGHEGLGKTSSALFDETDLSVARILSVLVDLGFDIRMLREVHFGLHTVSVRPSFEVDISGAAKVGNHNSYSLKDAISGVVAKRQWILDIALINTVTAGEKAAYAFCAPAPVKRNGILHPAHFLPVGAAAQAVVTLPLNDLLSDLLQAASEG